MFMRRVLYSGLFTAALAANATADGTGPNLGTPLPKDEIAKWDGSVFSDGRGLPPGRGNAIDGRALYAKHCASCHGERGEGATAEELVGEPKPPSRDNPAKAIGPYWPYATTIFDFIRRSMPPQAPGSLSDNQVYALTAFLLNANGIIGESSEIDARSLPRVKMPNSDGFVWIDATR